MPSKAAQRRYAEALGVKPKKSRKRNPSRRRNSSVEAGPFVLMVKDQGMEADAKYQSRRAAGADAKIALRRMHDPETVGLSMVYDDDGAPLAVLARIRPGTRDSRGKLIAGEEVGRIDIVKSYSDKKSRPARGSKGVSSDDLLRIANPHVSFKGKDGRTVTFYAKSKGKKRPARKRRR